MKIKWPREKKNESYTDGIDVRKELSFFIENYEESFLEKCSTLIDSIVKDGVKYPELQSEIKHIIKNIDVDYSTEDYLDLISTWACVLAMVKSPSLNTWLNIKNIFYHSNNIMYWLEDSIFVHAKIHPKDRKVFITLSELVIDALELNKGNLIPDRYGKSVDNLLHRWKKTSEKLTEIWWGLRGGDSWLYNCEFVLFSVFKTFDKTQFIKKISSSENPYLIDATLYAIGVDNCYSCWEDAVKSAPIAFSEDGGWNGSILLPLLLVAARRNVQQAVSHLPQFNLPSEDEAKAKAEIAELTSSIAALLNKRSDALPLFARWSTWLMREIIVSNDSDEDNVTSPNFINHSLIKEIGKSLPSDCIFQVLSKEVPLWENWIYRSVLTVHSYNGFIQPQDCESFIDEWNLKFEDWKTEKGRQLIESSSLFNMQGQEIPSPSNQFLAYSFAMSESPTSNWKHLWSNTRLLREIVELGDIEDSRLDRYKGSTEAVKLIWLAFSVGIATLDQLVQQYIDRKNISKDEILNLYRALLGASNEMKEINYFIDIEKWEKASLVLFLRRLHWDSEVGKIEVFDSRDKPSFADLVEQSTHDVVFFWRFIEYAIGYEDHLLNKIELPKSRVVELVDDIKLIKSASDRKYSIDLKVIEKCAKRLLDS
ncbi:hypothetical protein [Tolumonas lignilytica]|uniref:hypothetical protein n=1 Tax=Tolumonas lignilytica TaxID=1283284 RepID=UPI0004678B95|nr:hypothetical protein [Tolumonas lignilytica]